MFIHHIWGVFLVLEMILLWFFSPDASKLLIPVLNYLFWPIWIAAMILIIIPIITFRKKGGVAKEDSYINTQKLVDTGIFKIIRHPQYTGGMWVAVAMVLPNQSLLIVIFMVLALGAFFLTIFTEEVNLGEKFGEEYIQYKKRTSSCSLIVGSIKSSLYKETREI